MRLLHTADWHAGRNLRGIDRTPEIRESLSEILEIAVSEKVDAILVAGDLFDSPNPSADAEAAVYDFFLESGALGIPSVVIAGNHDSPQRLESVSGLLKRVKVSAFGVMKADSKAFELELDAGKLVVAGLPFLSERRLVKAASLMDGEFDTGVWRQKYREGMGFFIDKLAQGFQTNAVNVMMLHTTLDGGTLSGSEFSFFVTNSYAISADQLPSSAQYVALGHLHKPQRLGESPVIEYAGSIVQLDFGEAGEQKRVNLIEAFPGRPAKVHSIPLSRHKTLKNARVSLDGLESRLEEFRSFNGLLKVTVKLEHPMPGLKDRVMGILPNAVAVEVELEEGSAAKRALESQSTQSLEPIEAFKKYYSEKRGKDVPIDVQAAFLELYAQTMGETRESEGVGSD